jgi:nucleoside-diphosphate-sugar epimerase
VRVLITGICGFVGSSLARHLRANRDETRLEILGMDNLARAGSETNRRALNHLGVTVLHGPNATSHRGAKAHRLLRTLARSTIFAD